MDSKQLTPSEIPKPTRRKFLRRVLRGGAVVAGITGLGTAYGFWEALQIRVRRQTVTLPSLPRGFEGKTIAVLADFHHGPFVSIEFIRNAIGIAQGLSADAYVLVGDFAHKGTHTAEQLPLCLEAVSKLTAPLGVFAVPGNHDMQNGGRIYREAIAATPLMDLTNRSVRVCRSVRIRYGWPVSMICGGASPTLKAALSGVPKGDEVVLLSHNPDFAEEAPDPRVGLMLSGQTHGGQAYFPGAGTIWMPSKYGDKYRGGLVQGPGYPVFVTRGLGEAGVPMRLNCPPEINVLTLTSGV